MMNNAGYMELMVTATGQRYVPGLQFAERLNLKPSSLVKKWFP